MIKNRFFSLKSKLTTDTTTTTIQTVDSSHFTIQGRWLPLGCWIFFSLTRLQDVTTGAYCAIEISHKYINIIILYAPSSPPVTHIIIIIITISLPCVVFHIIISDYCIIIVLNCIILCEIAFICLCL